jgi:hypothetical protein
MKTMIKNDFGSDNPIPANAKWAFTARRVKQSDVVAMDRDFAAMQAGDLLLVQVERIGNHKRFHLTSGRPSEIYVGDFGVVACAARYAPDQFEGWAEINPDGCDLLAGGGVAGKLVQSNEARTAPTRLRPVGRLLNSSGRPVNVADYRIAPAKSAPQIPVLIVTGASMNAGKTTMTTSLAFGLRQAGFNVAGIKATGTGSFGDHNAMSDAGLHYVADFTDAGLASTYMQPIDEIERAFLDLVSDAQNKGAEVAVVELADGIYQLETAQLLETSKVIRENATAYFYACGDAVSAVGGVRHLRSIGIEPAAISGMISLSPMAAAEASNMCGVDVVTRQQLMDGAFAGSLLARLANPDAEPVRTAA